jgi:hypothetical protein
LAEPDAVCRAAANFTLEGLGRECCRWRRGDLVCVGDGSGSDERGERDS